MIILYIPFLDAEKTTLLPDAKQWQNTVKAFKQEKCIILQYNEMLQDDIDPNEKIKVYVLGHGYSSSALDYAARIAGDQTGNVNLTMQAVAKRFEKTFKSYASQITSIKLYFCNELANGRTFAKIFQQGLEDCKGSRVDYYAGTVFAPDPSRGGMKATKFHNGQLYRASFFRESIYPTKRVANDHTFRLFVKEKGAQETSDLLKQNKKSDYIKKTKVSREHTVFSARYHQKMSF